MKRSLYKILRIGIITFCISCSLIQEDNTLSFDLDYSNYQSKDHENIRYYDDSLFFIRNNDYRINSRNNSEFECDLNDCCCSCQMTVSVNDAFPPISSGTPFFYVHPFCTNDFEEFSNYIGQGTYVSGNIVNNSYEFNLLDEHYYWFYGGINGTQGNYDYIELTVTDNIGGSYTFKLNDQIPAPLGIENFVVLRLHCDRVSFESCFPNESERICCI